MKIKACKKRLGDGRVGDKSLGKVKVDSLTLRGELTLHPQPSSCFSIPIFFFFPPPHIVIFFIHSLQIYSSLESSCARALIIHWRNIGIAIARAAVRHHVNGVNACPIDYAKLGIPCLDNRKREQGLRPAAHLCFGFPASLEIYFYRQIGSCRDPSRRELGPPQLCKWTNLCL